MVALAAGGRPSMVMGMGGGMSWRWEERWGGIGGSLARLRGGERKETLSGRLLAVEVRSDSERWGGGRGGSNQRPAMGTLQRETHLLHAC